MLNRITFVMIAWAILAASGLAEVRAKIDGPAAGSPGDLVVLSRADSVGAGFRWITPAGVQTINCGDGSQLAFATGRAGSYTFTLVAADLEANIDFATHTVTIGIPADPVPAPGPAPGPGPDPRPVPTPGDFGALVDLSRNAAAALSDPETARGLAEAIATTEAHLDGLCSSGRCPGLEQTKAMMVAAIERRLSERTGSSRLANWLDGWRVPINNELKRINAADVPTYRAAMRAVGVGLNGF